MSHHLFVMQCVWFVFSETKKDEKSRRKYSDADRRDAVDTAPTRESRRDRRRMSRSGSRDKSRAQPAGEPTRTEKTRSNGSSRRRSSPAQKRSPSLSSSDSDSEVVYGKVQSKVDVKRSEVHDTDDRGKRLPRRSPEPVLTAIRKGRPEERVDSKSSSNRKTDITKGASSVKKTTQLYSSDSSASPSPERNGRRMQSTVVEKPTPTAVTTTERRKVVATQKPVELFATTSPVRSAKHERSLDRSQSPVMQKHTSSPKAVSPGHSVRKMTTPETKKEVRETRPDKSRSRARPEELLEKNKKGGVSTQGHRRRSRSGSSPKPPKKGVRDTSSDSSSSEEESKRKASSSDHRKKTQVSSLKQRSSSASDKSDQESPDVRREMSHEKAPRRHSPDRKSDKRGQTLRELSDGRSQRRVTGHEPEVPQMKTDVKKAPSPRREDRLQQKSRDRSPAKPPDKSEGRAKTSPMHDRAPDLSKPGDERKKPEQPSRSGEKDEKTVKSRRDRSGSSTSSLSSSSSSSSEDESSKPAERPSARASATAIPSTVEMRQQRPLVAASDSESKSKSRSRSPPPATRSEFQSP